MLTVTAEAVREALDFPSTIVALEEMLRTGCEMPVRHHHTVDVPGAPAATLLLMPAWSSGAYLGVKIVNVFPGNADAGIPAVIGMYLLFSAKDGSLLATIDGGELTARRTAAASALAARYLAREDASRLLIVGTGRLAGNLAAAHAAVRPIKNFVVWGRNLDKASGIAKTLASSGLKVSATDDLASAVGDADIVSCATLANEPLIKGEWLRPGTHLDLIGGFTPTMREADDAAIRRATVIVDTRAGAMKEAGDIVVPLANGTLKPEDVKADLYDLTRGHHPGRTSSDEITLFKSVGVALEDLAAAALIYRKKTGG
ncbi:MAG TPA: ornithine cyclodeaminase family protein [Magnetospirillaceae bacterium]|jgi:ornithine cyclodeaminase